ncbi:MAG: ABC transporter ATP-binding protein/permease, partial [Flavobacteriaceae bacterium]|nr:ABC transporter ATP-binding protein/permease [Flavobacteriaceae bacterium]
MFKKIKTIYSLIPKRFQKKSIRYMVLSITNVFFDLLSIAYIIPLFVFILDKEQMPDFIKKISFFNESYLLYWVIGIILLFFIKNFIQIEIIKFQSKLVFDIATRLSSNLTKRFLKRPFKQIQHLDKGKEIQKIQMSGTDFSNHILLSFNTMFTELTVVGIIGIISVLLYPKFSILIFLIALLCLFSLYKIRKKKIEQLSTSIRKSYSEATSHLLNIIDGFLEIKSLGKESFFQKKYEETLDTFNNNFAVLKKHQNSNAKYLEIFIILGLSLFLYYINLNFGASSDKVILISYVAGISLKLFPSLNKLIIAYTNFRSYSYTIDLLAIKSEKTQQKDQAYLFKKSMSLKDISYAYNDKQDLLKDINLSLKRGEIIGIKGRSGIGKTTLLNIVMGFLSPKTGSLFIDETEVKNNKTLLSFIGYVPQQPFLFQGSLLDNIVMGVAKNEIDFV